MVVINIPDNEWEPGDEGQLLAHIEVNGCDMHLEAYEVSSTPEDEAELMLLYYPVQFVDAPDWFVDALHASAGGEKVKTVLILGKPYVLIATPFQF